MSRPFLRRIVVSTTWLVAGLGLTALLWFSFSAPRKNSIGPGKSPIADKPPVSKEAERKEFGSSVERSTDASAEAACERALRAPDLGQRSRDLDAAVRTWAMIDPKAALVWAQACASELRGVALSSVAGVLAEQPQRALSVGREVMAAYPASANEVGSVLVGELVRRAEYSAALQLAVNGPSEMSAERVATVLGVWTRTDPAVASEVAQVLRDQGVRGEVFTAVADGWAQSAPAQLVDFALTLPAGENRHYALQVGLDRCLLQDPSAAGSWLHRLETPREFEEALAAYVIKTDALQRPTATALAWAEDITDPALRFKSLSHVVQEWAAENRPAAHRYVETLPGLTPEQRQQLVAALTES